MKQNTFTSKAFGIAVLAAAVASGTASGVLAQSQPRAVSLDAGTVISVKLDDTLSSKDSRKGDTFNVTLRTDADANYYGLPTGTHLEGVVRDVRPQRDKDPGVLDLAFRNVRLPDGRNIPIEGSLIGLDNNSVEKRSDGRLVAKPGHKNDRLTYVGYGAGAGLVVGLLSKKPLEDAVLGGGLGYLFGALQKGQNNSSPRDVTLKSGQNFGVRLDRQVSLASYGDYSTYRNQADDAARFRRDDPNRPGYKQDEVNTRDNRDTRNDPNYREDPNNRDNRDSQYYREHRNGNRNNIGVMVGDTDVSFASGARPLIANGVTMVPARAVLDAAHIPFTFEAQQHELRAKGNGGSVRLNTNSPIAIVNGTRRVKLDGSAQQINGTLYIPMRFLSLVTGQEATYDSATRTVIVNTAPVDNVNNR